MDPYQDSVAAIVRDAMDVIEQYRNRRGLSCDELAARAVIARQSAFNLRRGGTKRPSMGMVARLWLALKIPPRILSDILTRHGLER